MEVWVSEKGEKFLEKLVYLDYESMDSVLRSDFTVLMSIDRLVPGEVDRLSTEFSEFRGSLRRLFEAGHVEIGD